MDRASEYLWSEEQPAHNDAYLWEPARDIIQRRMPSGRIFEVGCGNGATAAQLADLGYDVTAIDPSEAGIAIAQRAFPKVRFALGSVYDDLATQYGQFPLVLSLEVIEHCMWSKDFAASVFRLVAPGGAAVISTPFHGYVKNLVLAATGKLAAHMDPLWDGGHIKFFTEASLRELLIGAGFASVAMQRVGRIPPLAKSMIAVAHKH
jgi:2-polyprenyl-3-methyl-5-hydroxy-6-metoxy-1,4-benzoquinol methylase